MTTATSEDQRVAGARASFKVEGGPQVAAKTRAKLAGLRAGIDPVLAEDMALLLSELVTNSYRHSGCPDAEIGVDISISRKRIRCEITDEGEGFAAQPVPQSERGEGGWGLFIVDRLADRWGVRTGPPTRTWFELAR
jgi:anti-sigma regulatory factor (Ser/Thr protein kinase)